MERQFLDERRRALEGWFFRKRDDEILARLHAARCRRAKKEAVRRATRVSDDEVLDRIVSLGVDSRSLQALVFAPLIAIAWTDGRVDDRERRAICDEIESAGMRRGSPADRVFQTWLNDKPPAGLLAAWEAYIRALCRPLQRSEREWLAAAIRWRAHAVASASGGILGSRFRESQDKIEILGRMDRAFE